MHRWSWLSLVLLACGSNEDGPVSPGAPQSGSAGVGQAGSGASPGGSGLGGAGGQSGAGQAGSPGGAGSGGAGTGGAPVAGSGGGGGELAGAGQAGAGAGGAVDAGGGGAPVGGAGAGGVGSGGAGMAGSPVAGAGTGGAAGEASGAGGAGQAGEGGQAGAPMCGSCPVEVGVPLWEEPTAEKVGAVDVEFCTNGADDAATPPECWVKVEVGKASLTAKVSAGLVTFSGFVPVHLPASHHKAPLGTLPNVGTVAPIIAASVGKGQGDDCSAPSPTVAQISWVAPLLTDDPAPALGCSDLGKSVNFTMTVPDGDTHLCGKCDVPSACAAWDETVAAVDNRVRQQVNSAVRAALDEVATKRLCLP